MIEEFLFKMGVPTCVTQLETQLPADVEKEVFLGQNAPTNIGWIYGVSVNCEGTGPDTSKNLITLANAKDLWINFKIGSTLYMQSWRLSELVFTIGGTARTQTMNYQPISLPLELDWKKSFITNNGGVTSKYVVLNLWYIDKDTLMQLQKSGTVWNKGMRPANV